MNVNDLITLRGHGETQHSSPHPYTVVANCFCNYCKANRRIVIGCMCEFCRISEKFTFNTSTDCDSEEGITVGLIDSIISISKVLSRRLDGNALSDAIHEALKDLMDSKDLKAVLDTLYIQERMKKKEDE